VYRWFVVVGLVVVGLVVVAGCDSNDRCQIMCDKVRQCGLPSSTAAQALQDRICSVDSDHEVCEYWVQDFDVTTQEGQSACVTDQALSLAMNYVWEDASFPEDITDADFCDALSLVIEGKQTEWASRGVCNQYQKNVCDAMYNELTSVCKFTLPPRT
jgi:hypothetical protein